MPIYKGVSRVNPSSIFANGSSIGKVYVGDRLVWQKQTITPVNLGLLYNFYAVIDPRGLAPIGFRISNFSDLSSLVAYAGGVSIAGGKLKQIGYDTWASPNTGATDEFEFSLKGMGGRSNYDGEFFDPLYWAYLWCSTPPSGKDMAYMNAFFDKSYIEYTTSLYTDGSNTARLGGSIRAVKILSDLAEGEYGVCLGNDGKRYRTKKINGLEWTLECLAETKYQTGENVAKVTDNAAWAALDSAALCAINNNWGNVLI